MTTGWTRKRSRIYWYDQYALNEQKTAFSSYDPDRIAAELVETGADIIALYATNQFSVAYYPSKILPQHPNLEGRDYVGELMERLGKHGKKVILYINWLDSMHPEWRMEKPEDTSKRLDSDHPEITMESANGEDPLAFWADPGNPERKVRNLKGGKWYCPCINSPQRERMLRVASEILERYEPDGFHLDMFTNMDICTCRYCMPHLSKICGTEHITRDLVRKHWNAFIDWRCERSASFISELTSILGKHGAVAAHNAFAPLYINVMWGQDEAWLDQIDVFLSECFDAFLLNSTDLNSTSINVRWQHSTGKPPWILRTSTPSGYSHWPITPAQWKIYAAACKANGCKAFGPCGVGAYADTTSSRLLLDNVKQAFDFYMEDADLDEDAVSAARVALVFSWTTRKYYGRGSDDWRNEFSGWARFLMEEHIPFDVLSAERFTETLLDAYDLVILPNIACMSEEQCMLVSEYVNSGGSLVSTAETSCFDEAGIPLDGFTLGQVLGISRTDKPFSGPFAVSGHHEHEPAEGTIQKTVAKGAVPSFMVELDPAGGVSGGKDWLPLNKTETPVITEWEYGRGRSVYAAYDIGSYYETRGHLHTANWMREMIDTALPHRQIEVKAPRTVEITLWKQQENGRTIIHLANRTVPWSLPTGKRQINEVVPVNDIELCLPARKEPRAVSFRHVKGKTAFGDGNLSIRLSDLDAYGAVVIDYGT